MMGRWNIFAALLLMMLVTGCQSGPAPIPGMSALRVNVIAEPKAGVKDPRTAITVYDTQDKERGAFERVDYSALDEIVVWVEPINKTPAGPLAPITIDVNPQKPAETLSAVASVGQRIAIHNTSSQARQIYSVSDGNEFDLGSVPAGGRGEYLVKSAGPIEVLAAGVKEPVAEIYAAPSPWAKLTNSGTPADFVNLPPGQYRIVSWHPRLPGSETPVTLLPDQTAKVSVKVGVNGLPKVSGK